MAIKYFAEVNLKFMHTTLILIIFTTVLRMQKREFGDVWGIFGDHFFDQLDVNKRCWQMVDRPNATPSHSFWCDICQRLKYIDFFVNDYSSYRKL